MDLEALYKLGYGAYVVTSKKDNGINGQIANTIFQVTSEPLTVATSINKNNLTHQFVKQGRVLSASALCQNKPLTLIGRFGFGSDRDTDKFEEINHKIGETGAPVVLDNAVPHLEAGLTKEMDVGTHTISVGEAGNTDRGIGPGTPFEDITDDWVCPICGAAKDQFEKVD